MPILQVSGISKSFSEVVAVNNVSFTAKQGDIIGLLGPSGCGKTTILRLLAGIETPDIGDVKFDGLTLTHLPPQQRGFGLMFQDLALFPHMNVFKNIAFGLQMQRLSPSNITTRVQELLDLVEMPEYANRKVTELSGGERQRVALARALAPQPKMLMLDEPLGSLDRTLRDNLQSQVRRILKEIGVTSIYVTHDRDEAFAMSDNLLVMNRGTVVQNGTPEELVAKPANEFVARSLGFKNIFRGVVTSNHVHLEINSPLGTLVASKDAGVKWQVGTKVDFLINENELSISKAHNKALGNNMLIGTVTEKLFRGTEYEVKIITGPTQLHCRASLDIATELLLPGNKVALTIPAKAIRVMSPAIMPHSIQST